MLVSILGCLCSTAITTLVPDTGSEMTLVSAILGAAIPAFVTTAGRRRPLRIAATAFATVCALGFTYAGAVAVSPILHEDILPGSDVFNEEPKPPNSGTEDPPDPPIEVTPNKLECHPGCTPTVTIKNVSAESVVIDNIDFTGTDENDFDLLGQCKETLDNGEECAFDIDFDPADPHYDSHADLEISYGVPNERITISAVSHGLGETSTSEPHPNDDLPDLRIDGVTCAHLPAPIPPQGGSLLVKVQPRLHPPWRYRLFNW